MINPNFLQRRLKEYFSIKCIFFLLIQCTLVSHYRNQLFYLCAIAEKEKLGPVDFDGMNYLISDKKGPFFVVETPNSPVGSKYNTFIEANQSIHAIQQNVQINMNYTAISNYRSSLKKENQEALMHNAHPRQRNRGKFWLKKLENFGGNLLSEDNHSYWAPPYWNIHN